MESVFCRIRTDYLVPAYVNSTFMCRFPENYFPSARWLFIFGAIMIIFNVGLIMKKCQIN